MPYPIVSIIFNLAHSEVAAEWLRSKQHYCTISLNHAPVMLPQWIKRNNNVPLASLMHGDCLERMSEIPDGSVDMILADLPYGTTAYVSHSRLTPL